MVKLRAALEDSGCRAARARDRQMWPDIQYPEKTSVT